QRARERPAAVAERPCGPLVARPVLRAGRPQRAGGGRVCRVPRARTEMESVNDTTPLVPLLHAAVFGSRRGTVARIRHPGKMRRLIVVNGTSVGRVSHMPLAPIRHPITSGAVKAHCRPADQWYGRKWLMCLGIYA